MDPDHYNIIKEMEYIPVGLGEENFSKDWMTDKPGENISEKNHFYGEYTFHYWLWKNHLKNMNDSWIGFCQYRKFWGASDINIEINSLTNLKEKIIKKIPDNYKNYDVILGNEIFINQYKFMKFLKNGTKLILKNPSYLFNKNKRNIKFHFDLMHGYNNLNKAIELLGKEDRSDFNNFVNSKVSFNPHNMFICKSKEILNDYYSIIFPWLKNCEKEFGFKNLTGYGKIRIYGFLAERFMSYWFQKNTKIKTIPIYYYDIGKIKL